ncbi:MAG: GyrI-like domain-containing protein [Lachnospiraceae bacterium]|nr:GyrI-like domain-containing protein [Lachnospiraceae bacterium]
MENRIYYKTQYHWNVNTIKYEAMTVFGIEAVSNQKEIQWNIRELQKTYCKIQSQTRRNRNTFITMVHVSEDGSYRIIVAGFIKRAEFKEYKIPTSLYAMVTIRGHFLGKIRKTIQKTEAYFEDKWLEENKYSYDQAEYIFWTRERHTVFWKNIVDVLFAIHHAEYY